MDSVPRFSHGQEFPWHGLDPKFALLVVLLMVRMFCMKDPAPTIFIHIRKPRFCKLVRSFRNEAPPFFWFPISPAAILRRIHPIPSELGS